MENPLVYQNYNDFQKSDSLFALRKFLPEMKLAKLDEVLDVGTGDGDVTLRCLVELLGENFANLIGLDKSPRMVEFAKLQNFERRVDFVVGDVTVEEDLRGWKGRFDHVFSFFCFNWVQKQDLAWKNLHDALKPGGDALVLFVNEHPFYRVYEIHANHPKWKTYMKKLPENATPYLNTPNPPKSLEKHVENAGFYAKFCQQIDRKHVYRNVDNLKKSIAAVSAYIKEMPENLVEDYLEDFVNTLRVLKGVEAESNPDGAILIHYNDLLVYAIKPQEIH